MATKKRKEAPRTKVIGRNRNNDNKLLSIPIAFQFLFKKYRYKILSGGRGSAKSQSVAIYCIIRSMEKKIRILCVRENQNSIKDSVYKLISELIIENNLDGFEIFSDSIKHRNGSEFIFKGIRQNVQSIKSFHDCSICWIEEGQFVSQESLDVLLPTIRAEESEVIITYNPPEEDFDNIKKTFPIADDETYISHTTYKDNPFFNDVLNNERLRFQRNRPDEYNNVWLGQAKKNNSGLSVIKYFNGDNIKGINYIDELSLYLSCDFNVASMAWIVAHKENNKYFFIDEICRSNTTTRQQIDFFIERYKDHKGKIYIHGDASGDSRSTQSEHSNYATINNQLIKSGLNFELRIKTANPAVNSRVESWMNKVLNPETGKREIFIDPNCENLIFNMDHLCYGDDGKRILDATPSQIRLNEKYRYLHHLFDAASYLVEFYDPINYNNNKTSENYIQKKLNTRYNELYDPFNSKFKKI